MYKIFLLLLFSKFIICTAAVLNAQAVPSASDSETYPGSLNIPINKLNLKGKALKGEEDFAKLLELNPSFMEEIYEELPSTENGKILDIDLARKLFPPFSDGTKGASLYSDSTHVPASQFINFVFNDEIKKIANAKTNPEIIFLAGGGGSGKGTVTTFFPNIYEKVDLILDGTLANFNKAKKRINFALDHGFKVSVIYVFRPIELALQGIVTRAIQTGRGVPIIIAALDHYDAQKTVQKLSEELKNKINFIIISNAAGFKDAKVLKSMDELIAAGYNYENKDEVIIRAIDSYLSFLDTMDPKLKKDLTPELKEILEKGMEKQVEKFVNQFKEKVQEPTVLERAG